MAVPITCTLTASPYIQPVHNKNRHLPPKTTFCPPPHFVCVWGGGGGGRAHRTHKKMFQEVNTPFWFRQTYSSSPVEIRTLTPMVLTPSKIFICIPSHFYYFPLTEILYWPCCGLKNCIVLHRYTLLFLFHQKHSLELPILMTPWFFIDIPNQFLFPFQQYHTMTPMVLWTY